MVTAPAATPVTKPVDASMVATVASLLPNVPPDVAPTKVVVEPTHTAGAPEIDASGSAFTVIEAVPELLQPFMSVTLYVIVTPPAATPVTRPVVASIVATVASLLPKVPP